MLSMESKKYPTEYDLKEICRSFLHRSELNKFMQSQGIFTIGASTEDVSDVLCHCIMQLNSIATLRDLAYRGNNKSSLSGFSISSSDETFSLQSIYEKCKDDNKAILTQGYRLGSLTGIQNGNSFRFQGQLDYKIKKPGRIELLEVEESQCTFYMEDIGNGEWRVEVDGGRASDGKEVQKLFNQLLDKSSTRINVMNIDELSDSATIDFFDGLTTRGLPSEWRFSDVKSLTFRRGRNQEDEEVNDCEDDENKNKNDKLLSGIKQAILEGQNLRQNSFVKSFENNGCIFTAMTFEFENTQTPIIIHIRAEFKGSPKIFEVSVVNSFKTIGTDPEQEPCTLSSEDNLKLRSIFWNNAKALFDEKTGRRK